MRYWVTGAANGAFEYQATGESYFALRAEKP